MTVYSAIAFLLVMLPAFCFTITVWAVHIDRRYMEPDRQKLLAEQRKEDCRHCRGSGEGFSALVREGWDGTLFHPFLDQRDAGFSGVRCEANVEVTRPLSMPESFQKLGDSFAQLGRKVLTEAVGVRPDLRGAKPMLSIATFDHVAGVGDTGELRGHLWSGFKTPLKYGADGKVHPLRLDEDNPDALNHAEGG